MAGQDIFFQPIIHNALEGMTENIESMNTQLSETTRILMNILNNQGLAQNQKAYAGSSLGALTKNASAAGGYTAQIAATSGAQYISDVTLYDTYLRWRGGGSVSGISFKYNCVDLSDATKFISNIRDGAGGASATLWTVTKAIFEDGTETTDIASSSNGYIINVPAAQRKTQNVEVFVSNGLTSGHYVSVFAPSKETIDGQTVSLGLNYFPEIGINASGILTYLTAPAGNIYPVNKNILRPVYITIPDIAEVAQWISCVINGNLTGIAAALVDNTTHDVLKVLSSKTNDISDVTQLTGLAILFAFAPGDDIKYISGFALRYF